MKQYVDVTLEFNDDTKTIRFTDIEQIDSLISTLVAAREELSCRIEKKLLVKQCKRIFKKIREEMPKEDLLQKHDDIWLSTGKIVDKDIKKEMREYLDDLESLLFLMK